MIQEWQRSEYFISTDVNRLDLTVIHQFLANTYWAKGIPFAVLQRSIQNSLVFGIYKDKQQIGFGRVITDYSTSAQCFTKSGQITVAVGFEGRGH
jgi:hypothetical protein